MNPNPNRADFQKLINEMRLICEKTAEKNKIPFSVLDEIFKDSKIAGVLLSLLKFGDQKNSPEPEETPENNRKRKFGP